MNLLLKWLVSAVALLLASALFAGIEISSIWIALLVALILGFLNAIVRPILILLTLPITVLTLGLFIFVINGLIFWFVASVVEGFRVDGFFWAFAGTVFVSIISWGMNQFIDRDKNQKRNSRDKNYYRVDEIRKTEEKKD